MLQLPACSFLASLTFFSVIHHSNSTSSILDHVTQVYALPLPFEAAEVGVKGRVSFVNVNVISLNPLIHCVHFKPTHSYNCIPFCNDMPTHIKEGWIYGERVRYLRLNSHRAFYTSCLRRWRLALMRMGHPHSWYSPFPLTWAAKDQYVGRRPKMKNGAKRVHVFRHRHNGSLTMNFSAGVKVLHTRLKHVFHANSTLLQSLP